MYNTLDIVSEMALLHPVCIHFDILVLGMWLMARVHRSILRRFAEAEAED
jgi:hypothetical protein